MTEEWAPANVEHFSHFPRAEPPVIPVYRQLLHDFRLAAVARQEERMNQIDVAIRVLEDTWPKEIAAYKAMMAE